VSWSNEFSHSDPYYNCDNESSLNFVDNAPRSGEDQHQAPALEICAVSLSPIDGVARDNQVEPQDPQDNVLQKKPHP
jgi:hypothetical protein